ncbi:MAG: lysine--tRNA ligase [Candidatus Micrarchaeota archaeon]
MDMAEQDLIQSKLAHLEQIRKMGITPYPYKFERTHTAKQIHEQFSKLINGEETKIQVRACGRLMTIRSFGKLSFLDVHDQTGKIQFQIKENETKPQSNELATLLDAGDFVGAYGRVVRTRRGEITILVSELQILGKSVLPLPEKWHGLSDVETRYRQRYLDLAINPEVRKVFETRSQIISAMREYLEQQGFIEVEIPLLQPVYGGANAKPFKTFSNALKQDLFLSVSPELYLKRLIVGGMEKVYTIGHNFRNEDIDKTHNPEFTSMESYAAYWDYEDVMRFTENAIAFIAQKVLGTTIINYQGIEIDLKPPWKRLAMLDGLKEIAKIDVTTLTDKELEKLVKEHIPEYDGPKIRGLLIAELFAALCEGTLVQPAFLIDYPKETTPLCKLHRNNPELIERFEGYINRWEISNAYSELNDPALQRKFLEKQAGEGRAGGTAEPVDEDFIKSIEYGMPPTGGLGIGIDRIVMLLTNQATIKDVILFPQMKNTGSTTSKPAENKKLFPIRQKKQIRKKKPKKTSKK